MRSLGTRIRRPEGRSWITAEPSCPACRHQPHARLAYSVRFAGEPGTQDQSEICPGCGRRQVYVVEFDDRD